MSTVLARVKEQIIQGHGLKHSKRGALFKVGLSWGFIAKEKVGARMEITKRRHQGAGVSG